MISFTDTYEQLLSQITENHRENTLILGIRSRGDILTQRLAKDLKAKRLEASTGALDISLYRDDFNLNKTLPKLQSTEVPSTIDNSHVIIVDDVIQTGRTIRAALDAISDFGRPKTIRMAALIDLGGRELPISCDYAGIELSINENQGVQTQLQEIDSSDEILVLEKKYHA